MRSSGLIAFAKLPKRSAHRSAISRSSATRSASDTPGGLGLAREQRDDVVPPGRARGTCSASSSVARRLSGSSFEDRVVRVDDHHVEPQAIAIDLDDVEHLRDALRRRSASGHALDLVLHQIEQRVPLLGLAIQARERRARFLRGRIAAQVLLPRFDRLLGVLLRLGELRRSRARSGARGRRGGALTASLGSAARAGGTRCRRRSLAATSAPSRACRATSAAPSAFRNRPWPGSTRDRSRARPGARARACGRGGSTPRPDRDRTRCFHSTIAICSSKPRSSALLRSADLYCASSAGQSPAADVTSVAQRNACGCPGSIMRARAGSRPSRAPRSLSSAARRRPGA